MAISYFHTKDSLLTPLTSARRKIPLEHEAVMLEEARAELQAGLGMDIDDPEVAAWLDSLGGEEEIALPEPNRFLGPRL